MLTYPSFFNGVAAPYQIEQSLRFNKADTPYLNKVFTSAGDEQKFTISFWFKTTNVGNSTASNLAGAGVDGGNYFNIDIEKSSVGEFLHIFNYTPAHGYEFQLKTNRSIRDPSAWMHLVLAVDTTQATASNRVKIWLNGVQETSFATESYPAQNRSNLWWGGNTTNGTALSSQETAIGRRPPGGPEYANAYIAEFNSIDGQYLTHEDFGEFDDNGVWRPIKYTGTYTGNSFYLKFDAADVDGDSSGLGNDFTAYNFTTSGTGTDVMDDTPTNNYATASPLRAYNSSRVAAPLSDGNLTVDTTVQVGTKNGQNTFTTLMLDPAAGGQYQFEFTALNPLNFAVGWSGWTNVNGSLGSGPPGWVCNYLDVQSLGGIAVYYGASGTVAQNVFSYSLGDVVTTVIDLDTDEAFFYVNGTQQGQITGCNFSDYEYITTYIREVTRAVSAGIVKVNFGQQPFQYTPVSGAKPLSTAELPAPDISDPSEHFQALIGPGEGTGSTTPIALQWRTSNTPDTVRFDYIYGKLATDANADADHPTANWAANLSLNGFDDWYIPAFYELDILYYNLKPTTDANSTILTHGQNPNAVPPRTSNWTSSVPAQTSVVAFQEGGSEAFFTPQYPPYRSSTESSSGYKKFIDFSTGRSDGNWAYTDNNYARAIRRVPYTGSEPAIGASYEGGYFGGLISTDGSGTADYALIVAPKSGGEYGVATGILDVAQRTFSNGLWWVKDRANANQHQLVDSVRGGNEAIPVPTGTNRAYAAPTGNSLAYCWNLVTGRTNGFDIVQYTGNGTSQTVSHSLGDVPEIIWTKNPTESYIVGYHTSGGAGTLWYPGLVNGPFNDTNVWNNTAPTSTEFSVGTHNYSNKNGEVHTAYLWKSVPGFSKIGSFTANGSADGIFIYTGFRVAWVMLWYSDTGNSARLIFDSTINSYNPANKRTRFDTTDPESTAYGVVDLLSNGFKLRDTYWGSNPVAYMCFAENPFGGSRVSPATAR